MCKQITLLLLTVLLLSACSNKNYSVKTKSNATFDSTWYTGSAEIASYELKQSRYGEQRDGKAILISVTEDFNPKLQVKSDGLAGETIKVFKTNFIKRFTTGLYDYSTMTSTFVPVNTDSLQYPIKITCSSQDWCGQTWMQLNTAKNDFECVLNSYFEAESYRNFLTEKQFTIDQVFAQIKVNPSTLPQGKFQLYLPCLYYRFKHQSFQFVDAEGLLEAIDETRFSYQITSEKHFYSFTFSNAQPHVIYSFKSVDLTNPNQAASTTEAKLIHQEFLPY